MTDRVEMEAEFILRVVDYLEFGSGMRDFEKIEGIEEVAVQLIPDLYTNEEAKERVRVANE